MVKTVFTVFSAFVAVINMFLFIKIYIAKKKNTRYFSFTMLGTSLCTIFYAISINVNNYFIMKASIAVFFCCIDLLLACLMLHIMAYTTSIESLKKRKPQLWLIWSLVTLDMVFQLINPFKEIAMKFEQRPDSAVKWIFAPQTLYYFHIAFCYAMILVMLIYIMKKLFATPEIYRKKYYILIYSLILSIVSHFTFFIYQHNGILNLSHFTYSLLAYIVYWDIFYNTQKGMLNAIREFVLDELGHPVILFGEKDNLAMCNKSAEFLIDKNNFDEEYNITDFIKKLGIENEMENLSEDRHFQWNYTEDGANITYRIDYRSIKYENSSVIGRMFVFTDTSLEVDILTGFQTKNAFERKFHNDTNYMKYPVSIAILDINRLSVINKEYGEETGDKCIEALAQSIIRNFPENSYFARLNDANLLAITEDTDSESMRIFAKRVKEELSEKEIEGISINIQYAISMANMESPSILGAVEAAAFSMRSRKMMDGGSAHSSLLDSFAQTLLESDDTTEAHVMRTQQMGEKLGQRLGFSDFQQSNLSLLCLLHDIGKLGVPLEILNKPGKLSAAEWDVMKSHTLKGYRIAKASPELSEIADYILHHHESWDGNGYPDGLKQESIPLLSRVIAIVDSYDAMTNDRPYHKAVSELAARNELKRCAGTQFDPYLVSEFIQMLQEMNPIDDNATESETNENDAILENEPLSLGAASKNIEQNELEKLVKPLVYSFYHLDKDNNIVEIDDAFTEITGYTEEDLTTYHLTQWDLIPPEEKDYYLKVTGERLSENNRAYIEHRIKRKDGSYRYVLCFGKLKFDAVTKTPHSEIIITDIADTNAMSHMQELERESAQRNIDKWEDVMRKDSLTGLLNHESFVNDAELELMKKDREVAFFILDVDYFKNYNDSYGHLEGDKMLQLVAKNLKNNVKANGFAGRLGGDEFAGIISVSKTEHEKKDLENYIGNVFHGIMSEITANEHSATISLGAVIVPDESSKRNFRTAYQMADSALYDSKEKGRKCFTVK